MGDTKHSRLTREQLEELVPDLLYGELDDERAEQVRAQLPESELDGKVAAYQRLRDAFHSLPDEEPPPAISAQLLHAAAKQVEGKQRGRSASLGGVGLWSKLRDWLSPVVMHPGLAAAASILVVGGVVGMLYLKNGDKIAQPDVSSRAEAPEGLGATRSPAAPAMDGRLDDNVNRQLAEEEEAGDAVDLAPPEAKPESKPESRPAAKQRNKSASNLPKSDKNDKAGFDATGKSTGLIGGAGGSGARADRGVKLGETVGPATHGGAGGPALVPAEKPSPTPEPARDSLSDEDAPTDQARAPQKKSPGGSKQASKPKPDSHADARRMHNQARSAAEKGDCTSAQKLSARIQKTDPVYYRDAVRGDSQLSKCSDVGKK